MDEGRDGVVAVNDEADLGTAPPKSSDVGDEEMDATPAAEDKAAEEVAEEAPPKVVGEETLPEAQGMGGGAALWWNESESTQKIYVDRQFFVSFEEQVSALRDSKTVYIGNLSFYTTEAQIYELCARVGPVKRVVMGLNRHSKTPCGFCFVEHYTAEAALENVARITGLVLDDRILRSELDFGFREGRQYGRGQSGGQVRDDRRFVYDSQRSARKNQDPIIPAPDDDPEAREKAERRKRRFATDDDAMDDDDDNNNQPPRTEEPTSTGSKRRRRDDDDDDDEDEEDDA
ncbi:hypothetical protein CTAYLR_005261 [Chrysophaeum taylorii]|uniref:Nuclear cap-binding protein subunit 2 n=1 Tax=Chrysophaeum taylorii TaxID=2483200 RepID=A0AAD7UJ90_9STRA|nr:hypothetical protein CTAYLR_005261 [Chrysophaeum taylorii]